MQNISGFGLSAVVTATNTFPNGFSVSAFADDADPLDSPDLQVAETAFGLNGHMVVWSRPSGIEIAMNVITTTDDDSNLDTLLNANRIGKGKSSARDEVSIVFTYPDGLLVTCNPGVIISGALIPNVSNAGRFKTRQYRFRFESVNKSQGTAT